jgi:urea carboxylase
VKYHEPVRAAAGAVLALGSVEGPGLRTYLCIRGGFDVPEYLGSCSTFTLGGFGGHGGRALLAGDVLHIGPDDDPRLDAPEALEPSLPETLTHDWELAVLYGPHGAPDFFTPADIETFFTHPWEVHYNSARTGVRLVGPEPQWARSDGGEAGLHPSNIHDCAYAVGAVDFTGDTPILLGPDGPSLGGFVCPATVVEADLHKLGQLKPGDTVRFVCISKEQAEARRKAQDARVGARRAVPRRPAWRSVPVENPILLEVEESDRHAGVVFRRSGDRHLLVEYGPNVLDLNLRFQVHALMQWVREQNLPGVEELTPGIRSLQLRLAQHAPDLMELCRKLAGAERSLPPVEEMVVPTRIVHMPLSWDDDATRLAIRKYDEIVRKNAPWAPSNIEFIRRINGLDSVEDVKRIVFEASYLVMGLGDVYLGAPVATPVDPRHRLVTTKYNPARTWTPENAVGIGGAYLCIYGMEGPGGYQFVGRTLQVFNRFRQTQSFIEGRPWLLRFFDQIRFYPVASEQLLALRREFLAGRFNPEITTEQFDLAQYNRFLRDNQASIAEFKTRQQQAFQNERERWQRDGQLNFTAETSQRAPIEAAELPPGVQAIPSPVPGSVWRVSVKEGDEVSAGQSLLVLESMKMEVALQAPVDGTVRGLLCAEGQSVTAGQALITIEEAGA